MTLVKKKS